MGSARCHRNSRYKGCARSKPCRRRIQPCKKTVRVATTPSPLVSRNNVMRLAVGTPAPALAISFFMIQALMPLPSSGLGGALVSATSTSPFGKRRASADDRVRLPAHSPSGRRQRSGLRRPSNDRRCDLDGRNELVLRFRQNGIRTVAHHGSRLHRLAAGHSPDNEQATKSNEIRRVFFMVPSFGPELCQVEFRNDVLEPELLALLLGFRVDLNQGCHLACPSLQSLHSKDTVRSSVTWPIWVSVEMENAVVSSSSSRPS